MAKWEDEDEYTPAELADRLGVTRRTIYRWIKDGYLSSVKLGPKLVYVRKSALDKFLAGAQRPAAPRPSQSKQAIQTTLPQEMLPTGSGRIMSAPQKPGPPKGKKRRS